jgi:hypothetical protein
MTSNSNFPLAKKRGRPLGSTNKRTRKVAGKEFTFKDKKFKQVDEKLRSMPNIPSIPVSIIKDEIVKDQEIKILNLEHQAIGYRAVINYLEHQLKANK